jgi:hypothetical protein
MAGENSIRYFRRPMEDTALPAANGAGDAVIPDEDVARQAVGSLRGYAYQVWASALAWTALGPGEVLLLEVAEDFSILAADALAMRQVKDTAGSGSVTLRTAGVVQAISTLWRYQQADPARKVSMAYLTTSSSGKEQNTSFPDGLAGLEYWRQAARHGADIEPLRQFLLTLDIDVELKAWLQTASEGEVRDKLLQRIRWECGQPPLRDVEELLDDALIDLCEAQGAPPSSASLARDMVVVEILRAATSSEASRRRRTRAQLSKVLEQATSVSIPIGAMRSLMGGGGHAAAGAAAALEPLVSPLGALSIDRPAASGAIRQAVSAGQAWLFGASGTGKTALASSLARATNRPWRVIDLRDLQAAEAARRLREARRELLDHEPIAGVVVDDLPTEAAASIKRQLLLLRSQLGRRDASLLVISYKEPPPSLCADLGLAASGVLEAPYFTEAETAELIVSASGDPAVWTKSVQISCGGGHPQLVAARIAGLRSRGWPKADLLDLLEPSGVRDVEAEREAVRTRLYAELAPEARTLLYRLSFLTGTFDRELAMALGASPPPISQAGEVLDLLRGPWLESRQGGRLRVSPLVANAGSKVFSAPEAKALHEAIATNLAQRSPIPAEQLPQLLISSLASNHHTGFLVIGAAAISSNLSDEDLASTLFLLPFLRTDAPIVDGDESVNRMLRLAQLKVAGRDEDSERLVAIYRRYVEELPDDETTAMHRSIGAWFLLSADTPLAPREWFEPLADLMAGEIGNTARGMPPPERLSAEFAAQPDLVLFTMRTTQLRDINDLEAWFEALESLEPGQRERYLNGLPEPQAGRRTAVHMPWVRHARLEGFDPIEAANRYAGLSARAQAWGDEDLAVECECCRAVLLAEYGSDPDGALKIISEAEARWPRHRRLLRERAKILFAQGRYSEVLANGSDLIGGAADADVIDRVHIVRELALSAAGLGDFRRAVELLAEAEKTARQVDSLSAMAIGLQADQAFLAWRSGDRVGGLAQVRDALLAAEQMTEQTERSLYVVHALSIVVRAMYQDITAPGWDGEYPRFYGIASRAPREWSEGPAPNLLSAWYQFAAVEHTTGIGVGGKALLDERRRTGRIVSFEYIEASQRYLGVLKGDDPARVLAGLSEFARCFLYARQESQRGSEPEDDATLFEIVERLPWEGDFDPADRSQRGIAEQAVLVSTAFATARGERDWIARLQLAPVSDTAVRDFIAALPSGAELRPNQDDVGAALWALGRLLEPAPPVDELLLASVRLWEFLRGALLAKALYAGLGPMLAERWRHVAQNSRFAMRMPAMYAPQIEAAAQTVADDASLARLILAAYPAFNLRLPETMLEELRRDANGAAAA